MTDVGGLFFATYAGSISPGALVACGELDALTLTKKLFRIEVFADKADVFRGEDE